MDARNFDTLSRHVGTRLSRRRGLGGLLATLTALLVSTDPTDAAPMEAACRRLGKRCTGRHRRGSCCGGATCRQGRCRCGRRQQDCDGRCLAKDACCQIHCPAGEICGEESCGCVPDPSACTPWPNPCPNGDCSRCCMGTGSEVDGELRCDFQDAGATCGAGVECLFQGDWYDCVCNRCCGRSGMSAGLIGGCAACCSGGCDAGGLVCA